jgi:murein DD-endopeptidase MepM/ murein hydrolase activator NlpD
MRKNLTLIVFCDEGAKVRQWSVSRLLLATVAAILIGGMVGSGLLARSFYSLQADLRQQASLTSELDRKGEEIEFYREQIASFTEQINELKDRIGALSEFEKKIRVVANIVTPDHDVDQLGVGGSLPEDIDPMEAMKKDQAAVLREMHEQVDQLHAASALQAESLDALLGSLEVKKNLLACTPSIRPTEGWVSSSFGRRRSPFTGRKELHTGLDIANRAGTPIVASADGVVRFVGQKGLLGKLVVIDHGHGLVSRYGHLGEGLVKKGERVKRGDVIAKMGNTGRSTGPHLHYEIRLNGVAVNPSNYIFD